MTKQKYAVTGMTCSACSSHVDKSVRKLPGMGDVTVNLLTNSMQVSFDENVCDENIIIEAVEKAGYGASLMAVTGQEKRGDGPVSGRQRYRQKDFPGQWNRQRKWRRQGRGKGQEGK